MAIPVKIAKLKIKYLKLVSHLSEIVTLLHTPLKIRSMSIFLRIS